MSGRLARFAFVLAVAAIALASSPACSFAQAADGGALVREAALRPLFTDRAQMSYARFLMDDGDFKGASREFARVIEAFPGSPLAPDAQFGMAEAFLRSGRFRRAQEAFRMYLRNYPGSERAAEAVFFEAEAGLRLLEEMLPVVSIDGPPSGRERLTAVQVTFFQARSYSEIDAEMARLRASGVDTVIVRVFHNQNDRFHAFVPTTGTRGVYFRTSEAPVVADILSGVSALARKNGLKIFAWMTTRYADYGVEGRDDLACVGYDLASRRQTRCKGLDLFNEEAVRRLERLYADLAEYDIDGILFQDDLVLRHTEGFGAHAAESFSSHAGAALDPEALYQRTGAGVKVAYTESFWRWAAFKNRRLLDVAGRLMDAARAKKPGMEFAVNLMYESVTNPSGALAWLSQDLAEAARRGFDYYSVMAYHRQMAEELGIGPEEAAGMTLRLAREAAAAVGDAGRVLIKVQTIDWRTGEPLPDDEVVEIIRGVRETGGVSLAVVPYRQGFPFTEMGGRARHARAGLD